MRIRRQPQPQSTPQGVQAENSGNGSLSSPAVSHSKPACLPQHDANNMHASIEDISMIYSASKFRASVNWLDRLRAAKGFPVEANLSVEEVLSSRTCSSEETPFCSLEQHDSTCQKQENTGGVDVAGLACHSTDLTHGKVSESSSCKTAVSDIKKGGLLPCGNGVVEFQCLRRQTGGKNTYAASQLRDLTSKSDGAQEASIRQSFGDIPSVTLNNPAGRNDLCRDKCSRSTVVQSSLSEDSNIETAFSQLYFNMFAELFCMNSRSTLVQADVKRRHRKQEKPKVCSTFADPDPPSTVAGTSFQLQNREFDMHLTCALNSENPTSQSEVAAATVNVDVPSSSPGLEGLEATVSHSKKALKKMSAIDKKKNQRELDGVPKNDLLIIDTSLPGWRTEKVIYRKGNGWRIRSKGATIPVKGNNLEPTVIDAKKQVNLPSSSSSKTTEAIKVQRQWEIGSCTEKDHKADTNLVQCTISPDYVARVWNTSPHTHMRSSRKRRKTTLAAEEPPNISEANYPSTELLEKSTDLASDHPANQPKEGLVYSIYQVFMQAGKSGLTPREAVSRILEQGLPGLHEGGVVPRVEVLKIVSNSPYFMPLEESKYILCSALVGDEDLQVNSKQDVQKDTIMETHTDECKDSDNGYNGTENVRTGKQHGVSQYWAACAAIRRARTGTTRRKLSVGPYFLSANTHETHEEIAQLANKKRLKSVKQDVTGLGNQCNRSDGKGWHCPLRAKVGYLLCDHHLDRLRTRVKSHIKSKMLSITKGSKEERKRIITGSWVVKKVVERSRSGRPPHVSLGVDGQDNYPVPATLTPEMSGSRFY